jgi:Arc/MetJ-type ribon-helix-helix transcriptional regulator
VLLTPPHQVLENRSSAVYAEPMNINLPPEQEQWLKARIAHGEFASVDDGLRRMIADRMAFEASDLSWAKPYVDAGRAAAARGEVISMDEAMADIDTHMASLQR